MVNNSYIAGAILQMLRQIQVEQEQNKMVNVRTWLPLKSAVQNAQFKYSQRVLIKWLKSSDTVGSIDTVNTQIMGCSLSKVFVMFVESKRKKSRTIHLSESRPSTTIPLQPLFLPLHLVASLGEWSSWDVVLFAGHWHGRRRPLGGQLGSQSLRYGWQQLCRSCESHGG
jgi:hypothetical protein